jgi:hypothetical protein
MNNQYDAKVSGSGKAKSSNFKVPTLEEIREARKKRLIITMLSVYGDDSSDETGVRTFAVAGIVGTQEEWDAIKPAWVKATGGKIFHAADCESCKGDYKGISKDQCDDEVRKLTDILVKSNLYGYGFAVDVAAFYNNLPDSKENAPYYHCFSNVVMGLAEVGYLSVPREKVRFVFDKNEKVRFNSQLMLDYLSLFDSPYSEYIEEGDITFSSRKAIEVQAADLFAREVMKELDNQIGSVKRYRRKPLIALYRTNRFKWGTLTRKDFEIIGKYIEKVKQDKLWDDDYQKWLLKTKRKIDNDTNRITYLIYSRKLEKESQKGQLLVFPGALKK